MTGCIKCKTEIKQIYEFNVVEYFCYSSETPLINHICTPCLEKIADADIAEMKCQYENQRELDR